MKVLCATLWLIVLGLSTNIYAQPQQIKLVKDIDAGTNMSSFPQVLAALPDSSILFIANDYTHGSELWRSDGTVTGTYMVKDTYPGDAKSSVSNYSLHADNKVFFERVNAGLWVTDGTASGTSVIIPASQELRAGEMIWYKSTLYFVAWDNIAKEWDLWISDGTQAGTKKFKTICPNYTAEKASKFIVAMGKLFFVGSSDTYGDELWVTDGTNAGTYMVKDLYPDTGSGVLSGLHLYKSRLYFRGKESNKATYNIYSADTSSIRILKKINTEENSTAPLFQTPSDDMVIVNNRLMFCTTDTAGNVELWSTDGTDTGTHMMVDANGTIATSYPHFIGVVNNKLVFSAIGQNSVRKLWVSDGSSAGTYVISNVSTAVFRNSSTDIGSGEHKIGSVYDNIVYYLASDNVHGIELWRTDGTDTGTVMVEDFVTGRDGIATQQLYMHGKNLWLSISANSYGTELYLMDARLPLSVKNIINDKQDFATIYPNPNSGSFSVELNKSGFKNGYLKVTDINGRTIYDQSIAQGTQQLLVTLSNTPTGVYMVTVQLDSDVMTQSIVVQ